jgi:cyclase
MDPAHPARFHAIMANAHQLGRGGEFIAELFRPFDFNGIVIRKPDRNFKGELDLKVGDKQVRLVETGSLDCVPQHAFAGA